MDLRLLGGLTALVAAAAFGGPVTATPSAAVADSPGAASARSVPRPAHDEFYRYDGEKPLSEIPPGTPLRTRQVTLGATQAGTPLPARQILYRTTTAAGAPTTTVTTVVLPSTGTVAPRVVGYLSFYDALTSRCSPSFTLRGGDPGSANQDTADAEQAVVHTLSGQGFIVTVPDFENRGLHFTSGREAGRSALDGIRATLRSLRLPRSTPVGLMGFSGGSIAADWAAELAPRYSPGLDIAAVAAGGMPVDLRTVFDYVDGKARWAHLVPMALIGIARSYDVPLRRFLTPYGRRVVDAAAHACIADLEGRWPHLTLRRMTRPGLRPLDRTPPFRRIFRRIAMGSAPGHPASPMLVVAGRSDSRGDGVTIAGDMRRLAARYREEGTPVTFRLLDGAEHTQAGIAFMPLAMEFLTERLVPATPVS